MQSNNQPYELVKHRGKFALAIGTGSARKRFSTGTDDEGVARARARDMFKALTEAKSDRIADLWDAYLADRAQDGKNVARQRDAWKALGPVFGERLGHDIRKNDCREYAALRQRHGRAIRTVRTELEYLRACLNLRYGRGNTHVWIPVASKPRDRYLSREELDKLLAAVSTPHVRLFIILAVTTAARMSAILELQWDQVDFKHNTVSFNQEGREQNNKHRPTVPLNQRARAALVEASEAARTPYVIEWDGKPLKRISKAIRQAAARSGVACSPHVFRHTAGVWMAQADVPLLMIAQFMGHSTTKVTEHTYARYSPSFMKDAATALDF